MACWVPKQASSSSGEGACAAAHLTPAGSRSQQAWEPKANMDLNTLDPEHVPWQPHTWISDDDEEYCDYDPGTFEWYQSESDILKWEFQQLVLVRKWTRLLLKKCMLEYFKSKQMKKFSLNIIERFRRGDCSHLDVEADPGVGAEPSGGHRGGIRIQAGYDVVWTKTPGSSSSSSSNKTRYDTSISARVNLMAPPVGHKLPKSPQPVPNSQRKKSLKLSDLPCFQRMSLCC